MSSIEFQIYGSRGDYRVRQIRFPASRPGRPQPDLPSPFYYGPFRSLRKAHRVAHELLKRAVEKEQGQYIEVSISQDIT